MPLHVVCLNRCMPYFCQQVAELATEKQLVPVQDRWQELFTGAGHR